MTKNELKTKILEQLSKDKEELIKISNNQVEELQQKGQNRQRLEKHNHTAGQICYINKITTYINYYLTNGQ